jgi:large subunit ribosomal protein L10
MVREEKIKQVEELVREIEKSSVIGIIDMFKLPSKQLQEIRKKLRGKAELKTIKKSVFLHVIKKSKKEKISELEKLIPSELAMIFTGEEPFKFYLEIDKLKSPTFAKEGDETEEDIEIKAGATSLLPGPVISELGKVGIPAGVEEGKIVIKEDVTVAKKGDKISKELADVLKKLKVQPVKVGLNIVLIYKDGKIYSKEVLDLIKTYPDHLKGAFNQALNLSVAINYPTKESIKFLLIKNINAAKALEKFGGGK